MNRFSEVNPYIDQYAECCIKNNIIDPTLYARYDVKRGLRDVSGKGVLTGLTEISKITSYTIEDGDMIPCEGKLSYRGINIETLIRGFTEEERFGFEETTFLLLFGELPSQTQLADFNRILSMYRVLPTSFVRDIIMKAPSADMMNTLARSVLTLYSYDDNANDISIPNVVRQCLQLIALLPVLSVYGYQAYVHYQCGQSLFIHSPDPNLSTAENILRLLRPDTKYTELEAKILDIALILHAEHGGGNNSTFTNRVVTSSGTDTYSAMAASLASLKGPRHGGANIKVVQMFDDLKQQVKDWKDEDAIRAHLSKLLSKEAFDRSGLIYGMGHAIYSVSDPRAKVFKQYVRQLAEEKGCLDEFLLYDRVEVLASEEISKVRRIYKGVSANVDFYSGFVYRMLNLPPELYTPLFAVARISGWSAHRLEELINAGKIIRPAYKSVAQKQAYIPLNEREA